MGADLIGVMLVGPAKLLKRDITKAKKAYKALRDEAAKAVCWTFTGLVANEERLSGELCDALQSLEEFGGIYTDSIEEKLQLVADAAEDLVEQVVEIWHNGGYRDVMQRDLPEQCWPGKVPWATLTAAMASFGDSPAAYSTQGILTKADALGILTNLGIV